MLVAIAERIVKAKRILFSRNKKLGWCFVRMRAWLGWLNREKILWGFCRGRQGAFKTHIL